MKKIISYFMTFLLVLGTLTSCNGSKDTRSIVDFDNGEKVSYEYFLKRFAITKFQLEYYYGEDIWSTNAPNSDKTLLESVKSDFLDNMVEEKIILDEAKKMNITADSTELNKILAKTVQGVMSDPKSSKFYELNGIDKDFLKTVLENNLIIEKYKAQKLEEIEVPDDKVNSFYKENEDKFNKEQIKASHILISTRDENGQDFPQDKMDEAKKKADDIYNELMNGANFEELAKKYSDDGSAEKGGDLGFFPKGVMVKEFEDTAFSLNVGEISKPVKSQFGYHIIKVTGDSSTEEYKEEMKKIIRENLKNEEYFKLLAQMRKEASYKVNDELFNNIENDIKSLPKEKNKDKDSKEQENSTENNAQHNKEDKSK